MSFAKKTLLSAAWAFSSGYANIAIGFLGNLALARILRPDDFGVFAMASSLLVFVTMFTGFGSQEAILQNRDDSIENLIPTAFWISIFIGVIVGLVGMLTGLIAWHYFNSIIAITILVLSALVPLTSYANAQASVLRREMVYKPVALSHTVSSIASFILGIIAAILGAGPWALLIRQGAQEIIYVCGIQLASKYRLPRVYDKKAARWIWNFGWKKMFMQINDVIYGRYDNLMVGTMLGETQLGFYGQAYRLALLGQQFTQGAIAPILLPMFATIQFSRSRLQYGFERVFFWTCRFIPMLGIIIFFTGEKIVTFLYGEKWQTAGVYFQMMFVLFIFLPFAAVLKSFLVGSGYIQKALTVGWAQVIFFIIGITAGAVLRKIEIVIWVANFNYLLACLLMAFMASKIIPVNWFYLGGVPFIVFGITMSFGWWLAPGFQNSLLDTLVLIILLALVYTAFLILFELRPIRKEVSIILAASRGKF